MPQIRPISDLRNNFTDISKTVHASNEPVFLTKNGYGDMVVMSMEAYEQMVFQHDVYFKLKEAEIESAHSNERYSHDEVFGSLRTMLSDITEGEDA